jgi:hypothetical protein
VTAIDSGDGCGLRLRLILVSAALARTHQALPTAVIEEILDTIVLPLVRADDSGPRES